MRKQIWTFLLFILTAFGAHAQAPKYSNEFLAIGVGARALGMSNACISSTTDITSTYWNPAGLLEIPSNIQIGMMHSNYFAGIAKYDYGAIASKIDATSTFGISFIRFGVDDIPDTSELIDKDGNVNYDRIKSFSATDNAFVFSYARRTNIKGLTFGANVKVIHRKVGNFSNAWGFGLDAAIRYIQNKWLIGIVARDVTSTFNAWSYNLNSDIKDVFTLTGNEIPKNSLEITLPKVLIGIGRQFKLNEKFSLQPELALDMSFDGKRNVLIKGDPLSIDPHLGFELSYNKFIFLRGGIGNIQKETNFDGKKITSLQPNIGLGVKIKDFYIDYALTDVGDNSIAPYSNIFSLKLNINRKQPSSR